MGASHSVPNPGKVSGRNHSALPEDPVPYNGPCHEYRIVQVNSKLKGHLSFGFTAGQQVTSSDIQSYYSHLVQQYGEFFKMNTFFQIPLASSRSGFASVHIPFQGIFSRPTVYTPSEEKWQLHVEQSAIQISVLRSGSLFTMGYAAFNENLADIVNKISENAQKGGRLICMECSGNIVSQGMSFTTSPYYGVDLFFDMPQHPNPTYYSYTAYSTPMNISYGYSAIEIQCDWNGTLKQHLDQGWKLVDIFIAQQETQSQGRQYRPRSINTVWFFEKEVNKAQDLTPRYQVTMIEYYMPVSAGFGGVSAYMDLGSLLTDMGNRGWELVCVLDTPQTRRAGFTSAMRGVVIFFQRPLPMAGVGSIGQAPPIGLPPLNAQPPPYQ